ncbi:hypothetical protein [Ciceribacter sp. L1K22]|uniref:hypothetical protein n=1 Tax=Ciceribacter sp. L1K22 TaxID=2820275 RepID=UPI001ABED1BF|nr:hypothetical protein [Ciceribacter sp. L1K22]MBO3759590.1 hypothetical protein [Ciceribacter sp. L1K22]
MNTSELEASINSYLKRPSFMRRYPFQSVEMDLMDADYNDLIPVWTVPIRLIGQNGSVTRFWAMVSCGGGVELSRDAEP